MIDRFQGSSQTNICISTNHNIYHNFLWILSVIEINDKKSSQKKILQNPDSKESFSFNAFSIWIQTYGRVFCVYIKDINLVICAKTLLLIIRF